MTARSRVALLWCGILVLAGGYYLEAGERQSAVSIEAASPSSPSAVPRMSMQSSHEAAAYQASQALAGNDPSAERAVLDKYCVTCHNERLKTAGVLLDKADVEHVGANAELWEKVAAKLRSGEMPPAGRPRPDAATYTETATTLERALDAASAAHPDLGRIAVHRLNRAEYGNAIRDALHLDLDVTSLLRPDETGYGFDNIADVLTFSPELLEEYQLAAWKISRLAVGDPTINSTLDTYKVSKFLDEEQELSDELPLGTRGGTVIKHYFPLDGEYVLRIALRRLYGTYVILGINDKEEIDVRLNGSQVKLFTIGGECVGSKEPRCQAFRPTNLNTPLGLRVVPPEYEVDADKALEVRFSAKAGPATLTVAFVKRDAAETEGGGIRRDPMMAAQPDSADTPQEIDHVEIEGPFNATGPGETPSRRQIFVCTPKTKDDEAPCATRILAKLAQSLYRRPVSDHDVSTLMRFYQTGRQEGTFDDGIRTSLEALLVSPNFLLRVSADPPGVAPGSVYRVNDLDLASRLSFFLWSSIPDDQLRNLAVAGKLHEPSVLEGEVRRMLADPKASALVDNFFAEWLSLRDLHNVLPDPAFFPDFDENLRLAFGEETRRFIEEQLHEDHPVPELLTAKYTYVNERLAKFYGIPNVYGPRFRRVQLRDPNRAGLLGQGSILAVTSYSTRTSPVIRGKWLLSNILGSPPPPPPPNVPALVESGEGGAPPSSVRARMEQHRANPICASCHKRMDPLGFALENFNAIGRWRTTDLGSAVDATGEFPDGAKFSNPAEFRTALLTHSEDFIRTVTSKMLTYALGRGLAYYDMPAVRSIVRQAGQTGYRWSDVILAIVKSAPFQMNRADTGGSPTDQTASAR